jgi:hypothetical protein
MPPKKSRNQKKKDLKPTRPTSKIDENEQFKKDLK